LLSIIEFGVNMALREDILRKIERKQAELADGERQWERQKAGAEAYIQAMQEVLKGMPRDASEVKPEHILRAGAALARVRDLILAQGRPQNVNDILRALGKANEKKARVSLASSIGSYVRRGEIFVRTAPNTFGLLELGHRQAMEEGPPPGFGQTRLTDIVEPDEEQELDQVVEEDDDVPF